MADLPTSSWLGRLRARLEFTRQCREGKEKIVVQTMRPELGPKVPSIRCAAYHSPHRLIARHAPRSLHAAPPIAALVHTFSPYLFFHHLSALLTRILQVVDLSSTFVGLGQVWDGAAFVEASLWTVRIADVPVNMSEAYPTTGPLRCYRMLQLGLDMPFGYLLATLSEKEKSMLAAEDDPTRKLPELVYTMFVPLSKRIQRVNEASLVRLLVKVTPWRS